MAQTATKKEKKTAKIEKATPKTTKKGGLSNLKPITSTEQAREMGRRGGLASAETRAERRALRELLDICLMQRGEGGQTNAESIVAALVGKALGGDVKAFGMILETLGEKPKQGIDLSNSDGTLSPAVVDFSGQPLEVVMAAVEKVWSREAVTSD